MLATFKNKKVKKPFKIEFYMTHRQVSNETREWDRSVQRIQKSQNYNEGIGFSSFTPKKESSILQTIHQRQLHEENEREMCVSLETSQTLKTCQKA